MRGIFLIVLVSTLLGALVWFFSLSPSGDSDWLPEQSRVVRVEARDGMLHFRNVRDWTYGESEVLSREWIDMSIPVSSIVRTWFFIDHFSSVHGIAHPFLSFEFEDGRTLAISLEARREIGEAYSPLIGAVRGYELTHVWSTERDMVARRLVNAGHPVSMYPLELSAEESARLLALLAEDTNALAATPRFYNTVTGNCMNLLAGLVNRMNPGRLPYDLAWNLPGYADRYLAREGLIDPASLERADLARHREAVAAVSSVPADRFSAALRELRDLEQR
jgi:hypothetical protein